MRLAFGKRPMMFYQPGYSFNSSRARILYPDGRSEFIYLGSYGWQCWKKPCWSPAWRTTQRTQFFLMTGFDTDWELPPAEFLGYL